MSTCETKTKLTVRDEEILHRIFNPHLPFTENNDDEDWMTQELDQDQKEAEETEEVREAKRLEVHGVEEAGRGELSEAVRLFTEAIKLALDRPSGYNNRAQAYRLMRNTTDALTDLDTAISLSQGRGPGACEAYTQRGIIRKLNDDTEGALEDFKHASGLGGQFARSQVTAMNPYAAMCGAAVAEMMEKIRRGCSAASVEGEM